MAEGQSKSSTTNCYFGAAPLATRHYATSSEPNLKETLKGIIPEKRELLKKVKAHGDKVLGEVKVENTLGGMRYVSGMLKSSGQF